MAPDVLISEVGPRDGLQSVTRTMPTAAKFAWIDATRGLGLANCLAAHDVGVRTFDASLGGQGGCPYAPGASGNVVTEDLVFMFEAMGIATGIDLEKLIATRSPLMAGLPGEPIYGMTPDAGLPQGFAQRVKGRSHA
jgi:isopropylmalate/homocitrate/citramalate synthase